MPRILIQSDPNMSDSSRLTEVLEELSGWDLVNFDLSNDNLPDIEEYLTKDGANFIIFSFKLNPVSYERISRLASVGKLSFLIYCNSSLNFRGFSKLSDLGIDACYVGKNHLQVLGRSLPLIWQTHWKKVPSSLLKVSRSDLHPRAKKILRIVENNSLKNFNTNFIASSLKISKSHFRAEFTKYFDQNFREFKKILFGYYESELLLKRKFRPSEVYSELNYSSLANLSRSFRALQGNSWREEINNSVIK